MKIILAVAALAAGLTAGAPSSEKPRSDTVQLTFWAAADNTFTVAVPTNGSTASVYSDLAFSSVSAQSPGNTVCHTYDVDASHTVLYGSASDVPIAPPQEQVYALCTYL